MALIDNIVAYYKFDETTGSTLIDSTGNYNGTNSGATINQTGKIGKSYSFDGSNDYVSTSLVIPAATASTTNTYAGWIYFNGTNDSMFLGSDAGSSGKIHLYGYMKTTGFEFGPTFYGGTSNDGPDTYSFTPSAGWYHIAFVKTAAKTFDVYINGVKRLSNINRAATAASNLSFGRAYNAAYRASVTDEIYISDRALSSDEISLLYNNGDGITYPFFPSVITTGVSNITTTGATFSGNCINLGLATEMGFCYNKTGNPTISDSKTTTTAQEGVYSQSVTGLDIGEMYYVKAYITDTNGTSYGEQIQFYTKVLAPINFSSVTVHNRTVSLSWEKYANAERTMIRRKEGSYPESVSDGKEVLFDSPEEVTDTNLTADTTYYYRAWGWDLNSGFSEDYDELEVTTLKEYLVETSSINGTITRNSEGYDGYYEEGYELILTTTPSDGYVFFYWSGDGFTYTSTYTTTITKSLSLEANFVVPIEKELLFPPLGTAISEPISGHSEPITKATMKVDYTGSFTFYMSIDGENWEEVTNNSEYTFINSGNSISWKIVESAGSEGVVRAVVIDYLRTDAETLRFRGKITRKTNSNDEELTLSGKSIAMITTGINIIYSSVGSKKRSDILKEIIEQYFDGEITTKYIEEDTGEMDVNYDEIPFWSIVEEICNAGEYDAYIDVDMNFHYFPRGSKQNNMEAVVENVNLIQTSDYATDTEETYTKVRLYGAPNNGIPLIYTTESDTTNTKGYEKVYKINDNNVKTMDQARDLAEYTFEEIKQMPQIGACKSLLLPHLMPGEKLFIANPQNGIAPQYFEIQGYQHSWTEDSAPVTDITIKKPKFSTSKIIKSNISFQEEISQNTNPEDMDFTYIWDFKDDIEGSYSGTYRKEIEFVNVKGVSTCSKGALKTDTTGYWESEDIVFGSNFTKLKLKIGGNNISNVTSQFSVDGGSTWKSFNFSGQASMLSSDTIRVRLVLLTPDVEIFSVGILYSL